MAQYSVNASHLSDYVYPILHAVLLLHESVQVGDGDHELIVPVL